MPLDGTTYEVSEEVQIIIKMRDLIDKCGHIHGDYANKNGYCLIGAYINCRERSNIDSERKIIKLIQKEITNDLIIPWTQKNIKISYSSISDWNDTHNKKETLAMLDRIIEKNLHPHEAHAFSHG